MNYLLIIKYDELSIYLITPDYRNYYDIKSLIEEGITTFYPEDNEYDYDTVRYTIEPIFDDLKEFHMPAVLPEKTTVALITIK